MTIVTERVDSTNLLLGFNSNQNERNQETIIHVRVHQLHERRSSHCPEINTI